MSIDSSYLMSKIRAIPDWPEAGVTFRDITPLLQDPVSFRVLVNVFVHHYLQQSIDAVAGIDARGFILGSVIAYELNVGFIPIRKKGKLPFTTISEAYQLEYGSAVVEMHTDAVQPGQHVLLVDDLIATGGTMLASIKLLKRLGAQISAAAIIDLQNLQGSTLIAQENIPLFTPCVFD